MNESFYPDELDPELEARIVALVLGEVSDFERDQLEQLIEARPELLQVRKQLEEVHGLLAEVGNGELPEDEEDEWKLGDSQRSQLFAVFDGEEENPIVAEQAAKNIVSRSWMEWANVRKVELLVTSACIVVVAGLIWPATQMQLATMSEARDSTRAPATAQPASGSSYGGEMAESFGDEAELWERQTAEVPTEE